MLQKGQIFSKTRAHNLGSFISSTSAPSSISAISKKNSQTVKNKLSRKSCFLFHVKLCANCYKHIQFHLAPVDRHVTRAVSFTWSVRLPQVFELFLNCAASVFSLTLSLSLLLLKAFSLQLELRTRSVRDFTRRVRAEAHTQRATALKKENGFLSVFQLASFPL